MRSRVASEACGQRSPLWRAHPRRIDIPLLSIAALVTLWLGLTTPLVQFSSLLADDFRYSVLSGLERLWHSGHPAIVAFVFLLSVVFPLVKLVGLLFLWFVPMQGDPRRRLLRLIEPLGKWSMLDVLVVILFAGAVRLGLIARAETLHGTWIYAGAILLSMLAASLMARIVRPRSPAVPHPHRRSLLLPVVAVACLVLLVAGLWLPLMQVEKWIFWHQQYSLIAGATRLLHANDPALALGFTLFVIVLPALVCLAQLALALVQLSGRGGGRALDWLLGFDRWAMLDVFALALLVAGLRLASWTDLTPRAGLWCLIGALVLSSVCSLWLRRLYAADPAGATMRE